MKYPNYIKNIKHGGVKSLVKRALEKGIRVKFMPQEPTLICLERKDKKVFIRRGTVPLERVMGDMTRNKEVTKMVLKEINIRTPRGITASSSSDAFKLMKKNKLNYPLIVKPIDDSLARGVTWDIRSKEELEKATLKIYKNKSYQKSKKFLVEEMFEGDEFRILVMGKKVISCVKKVPASVTGNEKLTIKQLIEKFNKKRIKGFEIKIDKVAMATLKKNKLNLNSILSDKYNLKLRYNLNMSDGGRAINYTHKINKRYIDVCERAVSAVGLTYGGVDLLTKDIASGESRYVIIEINPNPYYNMHEKPLVEGKSIDISLKILKHLFPSLK